MKQHELFKPKKRLLTPERKQTKREAHFVTPERIRTASKRFLQQLDDIQCDGGLELENDSGLQNRPTCTFATSSSSTPSLVEDCSGQRDIGAAPSSIHTSTVAGVSHSHPLTFKTGIPLQEEELLLYCLMKVEFPQRTFSSRSLDKFTPISKAIEYTCGIIYSNEAINNYFYRARKNIVKDLGKMKGYLRWAYFRKNIDVLIDEFESSLKTLLKCPTSVNYSQLEKLREALDVQCLSNDCNMQQQQTTQIKVESTTQSQLNIKDLEGQGLNSKENWSVSYNKQENTGHLFYFGGNKGYAQIEIIIHPDGNWNIDARRQEKT